jgi:hypothetical protein
MTDLRKLIDHLEHIEKGGEFIRELDPRTGRIVNKPVVEGEIGRKIGSTIGGIFGKSAGDRLGQIGSNIGDIFDKSNSSDKSNAPAVGNISDFSSGSVATPSSGQKPNGNNDQNTASNGSYNGSNIAPDDGPEDPKTWPSGVKKAPDFGYLDPQGMWIPTPFHIRTEDGKWIVPKNSPANLKGIQMGKYTPFQKKFHEMEKKVVYTDNSAIEQTKPVQLPGGAPQIPGYKQIDASRFSTDAREPNLNKTIEWVYAYQNGKNIILIAPTMFYNVKLSIGRYYDNWEDTSIRSGYGAIKSANGTMHVASKNFHYNDMILDVVIHSTDPKIGPQILQTVKI